MHLRDSASFSHFTLALGLVFGFGTGCGDDNNGADDVTTESGGTSPASGGNAGAGNHTPSGGENVQGGAPQQGGAPPQQGGAPPQQGGAPPQQGGAQQQGGAPPQQGGAPPQQGGVVESGGTAPQGGAPQQQGGVVESGGAAPLGGAVEQGGVPEEGGTSPGGADNGGASDQPLDCAIPAQGEVTFSAPSGIFRDAIPVTLSTTVAGAEIRYTTDGTAPTASSTLYSASLSLTESTRIRAQAFVGGAAQGTPSAAIYIASTIDATHDLPILVLDSYGSGELDTVEREWVEVGVLAFELVDGSASLSDSPSIANLAGFHIRGNSSAMFDKKPYRVELRDQAGDDRDCALFGMPAESDWALVPPHPDKALIRNPFVYSLGREMGMQAPRFALAEVYVNLDGTPLVADDYQGVYQIVEIIKNQKDRLDLHQLKETDVTEPDVTGGYIFKLEWMAAEEPLIPCPGEAETCWSDLELVDPDSPVAEQETYLVNFLTSFNDALHSATPSDPSTGYPAFIDPASFVDHVIVNEFSRNMDAYVRSQHFYKDRETKIFAGPLWDFDLTAGVGISAEDMGGVYANMEIEGWQYESNADRMPSPWFDILLADPTFQEQLQARYRELRQGLLSDAQIGARIDQLAAGLANAAERNFVRWPILEDRQVMPFSTPTEPTWAGQVEVMKTWLQQRAAWMDTQWSP